MQIRRGLPLGEQIFELLRRGIGTGEIAGGTRLVQGELAERLGTSRIPVRDALKRLEAEGLLTSDRFSRYTVLSLTVEDATEIYVIRHRLETLAVSLAAERATVAQLAELRDLFGQMGAAVRDDAADRYVDLNTRFHALVSEASCAPRLQRLVRGLWVGLPPLTPIAVRGRMRNSHVEHEAILACLEARDSAGVGAAMGQHIDNAHREFIATLRTAGRAEAPVSPTDEPSIERTA